jgi:hypothetical protein
MVNDPLGRRVVRMPRKTTRPLSRSTTLQPWPIRFWSTSYSASIRPSSSFSFSFQTLAPPQRPLRLSRRAA